MNRNMYEASRRLPPPQRPLDCTRQGALAAQIVGSVRRPAPGPRRVPSFLLGAGQGGLLGHRQGACYLRHTSAASAAQGACQRPWSHAAASCDAWGVGGTQDPNPDRLTPRLQARVARFWGGR